MHYPILKDSIFVKINSTLVKKQKRILQISGRDLQNDKIIPISEGGLFGTRVVDG